MVLWRDVETGEKTKIGDRCLDPNGWFTLDHCHVQAQPIVVEGCWPIQRIVKQD